MTRGSSPVLVVASLLAALGCASEPAPATTTDTRPQALLSAIGTAQALQHEADEHEAQRDLPAALESARRVLDVPFPPGAPEREDVRLDAYGRIAELELVSGDDAAAERDATAGLGEASRDSYFRARLHVVLGRIHQARAAAARERGDEATARTESEAAITALETSITINRAVLGLAAVPGATP